MLTIGITGGIAGGKSAVADLLADFPNIDADDVSRALAAPGSIGLRKIVATFGDGVLNDDGSLDRTLLRNRIAGSRSDQEALNGILHPLIREEIGRQILELEGNGAPIAFVSAALMIETGSYKQYDRVILVTAPDEVRLQRLLARDGMDETSARNLMAKQWSDERKRPHASVEVVNDGDRETLRQRLWVAIQELELGTVTTVLGSALGF